MDKLGQIAQDAQVVPELHQFDTLTPRMSESYVGRMFKVSGLAGYSQSKGNVVVVSYLPETSADIIVCAYLHEVGHFWEAKGGINSECRAWENMLHLARDCYDIPVTSVMGEFALACMNSYQIGRNTWIYREMEDLAGYKTDI